MKKSAQKSVAAIVAAMMVTAFSGITASAYVAYNTSVGGSQNFEARSFRDQQQEFQDFDAEKGGILKLTTGGQYNFQLSEGVDSGSYLFSFDVKMPEKSDGSQLLMFTETNSAAAPESWTQKSLVRLQSGGLVDSRQGKFVSDLGMYAANEWTHFDMVILLNSDDKGRKWIHTYSEGGQDTASINLSESSEIIHGFKKMHFVAVGQNPIYLDNLSFTKIESNQIQAAAKRTNDNKIELTLPAALRNGIDELALREKLQLKRYPLSDMSIEENVDYSFDTAEPTKLVLTPADFSEGYRYAVSMTQNSGCGYGYHFPSIDRKTSAQVNNFWSFEDGAAVNGDLGGVHTPVYEENRGYVLDFSKADYIPFRTSQTLTGGRYIVSYDAKYDEGNKQDLIMRTLATNGIWGYWQQLSGGDGIRWQKNTELSGYYQGYWRIFDQNQWYRIDNVFDLDNATYKAYVNGEYIGEEALEDHINSDPKNTPMAAFNGLYPFWNGGAGQLDNIRIKTFDQTYHADLTLSENQLVVDFDETTNSLTKDNFTVFKNGDSVNAELVYQNGVRAILQLEETLSEGDFVRVILNDVTSFLGTDLAENELTKTVQIIKVPSVEKTEAGLTVTVPYENDKTAKSYYVIYAGFSGTKLIKADFKPLELKENEAAGQQTITFEDPSVSEYDSVSVFVWDDLQSMNPACESVSK